MSDDRLETLRAKIRDDLEWTEQSQPATDHKPGPRDFLDGYCEALRWVLTWMGPPDRAALAAPPSGTARGHARGLRDACAALLGWITLCDRQGVVPSKDSVLANEARARVDAYDRDCPGYEEPAPRPLAETPEPADELEPCVCGKTRVEHEGPYGEGYCAESGCEAFEAAPASCSGDPGATK
jgi:hypothetical protein